MLETRMSAARALLATLKANGIDTIFGLPGSTEAPLLEALRDDGTFRHVLTLHESVTVAMADGYARASGRIGFAGLHASVGTMNGLSQAYNAACDGSPVVITAGVPAADLPGVARGFVKHAGQSQTADAVASDVRRAIGIAASPPMGPTYLAIPDDVGPGTVAMLEEPARAAFALTPGARLASRPDLAAVRAATKLLAAARRPILVLGADAAEHSAAARALADSLELPVFAIEPTQLARLPYPVCDERYVGHYGEERELIDGADLVLLIGARAFPAVPRLIHAVDDAQFVGWTNQPEIGLVGDTLAVLTDLRAMIERWGGLAADVRAERIAVLGDLRARYAAANARDRARHDALAAEAGAVSLVALTDALGAVLPAGALIFDEAIASSRAMLRHTAFPADARVFRTNGGSLGWGLPAAVGAKIAQPERAVVAVVGEGAFHFTPQAIWTAAREQAPVVTVIVDGSGTERSVDHATVARGYGADAGIVRTAAELVPALTSALASNRSTVIIVPVPSAR